jgi:hypothetical protein
MKYLFFLVAAIGFLGSGGWVLAADDADQQPKQQQQQPRKQILAPLLGEIRPLVRRYYPGAAFSASYDKKRRGENLHFQYNTLSFIMKDGDRGGEGLVEVRGPYVGGIWCDMTLVQGRYKGPVKDIEKGVTQYGADFYNYLFAPYSKDLDRHLLVVLRYPGGTPPKFLNRLKTLVKDFDKYVKKPKK